MRCALRSVVLVILAIAAVPAMFGQAQKSRWIGKINPKSLSAGGQTWVVGPQQPNKAATHAQGSTSVVTGPNINLADATEDVASGQSEVSIAAADKLVLAAWTDSSGLITQPSTTLGGSATGIGFSSDSGKTFKDLIGLPNDNIRQQWFGDPIVVAIDKTHFIVASLYWPNAEYLLGAIATSTPSPCLNPGPARFAVALSVATVSETNEVVFSAPIPVADGGDLCSMPDDLALLDRESMAYDPNTRTLAVAYTRFYAGVAGQSSSGQIEVIRAKLPDDPAVLTSSDFGAPVIIQEEEPTVVNTGASVAVSDVGDVYVTWERNWLSNLVSGLPWVYINAAMVPACSECSGAITRTVVTNGQPGDGQGGVRSLDNAADIVGYHIGYGNDFPQIVFNSVSKQLVVVWNDASQHPLGDVFMRALATDLTPAGSIYKVNDDTGGALHFMPSVSIRQDGSIATSWYDRRNNGPNSALTDYFGELRPSVNLNSQDFQVTTASSDWLSTASLVSPNFGDYTGNASYGSTTYFIWTDGRLGVAQPFADQVTMTPDYTVSANPSSATIDWGKSAEFSITVVPNALFVGDVKLACGTLPEGVTCKFDNTVLSATPNKPVTAKVTISAGTTVASAKSEGAQWRMWTLFAGAFGCVFLGGMANRRRAIVLISVTVLVVLGISLLGCGGSNPQATTPSPAPQIITVTIPVSVESVTVSGTHQQLSRQVAIQVAIVK